MKCFTYTLNVNGEGPAGQLPIGSITGMMANNVYYGAAVVDDLSNLTDWNVNEITPLEFNQTFFVDANTVPALVAIEPEIRKYYAQKMEKIAAPYTQQERDTWFAQVKEANDYQANNLISTPLITAMSNSRGVPVNELATNIINKDNYFRQTVGNVLGEQQALIDTIWKTQ